MRTRTQPGSRPDRPRRIQIWRPRRSRVTRRRSRGRQPSCVNEQWFDPRPGSASFASLLGLVFLARRRPYPFATDPGGTVSSCASREMTVATIMVPLRRWRLTRWDVFDLRALRARRSAWHSRDLTTTLEAIHESSPAGGADPTIGAPDRASRPHCGTRPEDSPTSVRGSLDADGATRSGHRWAARSVLAARD